MAAHKRGAGTGLTIDFQTRLGYLTGPWGLWDLETTTRAYPMERGLLEMVRIGQTIPDFEVDAYHEGEAKKIKLSDYRGKWLVLVFYPADFTFVCPTELEDAAEKYGAFQEANAEILSVSTDTVFVHKAWHDTSDAIGKVKTTTSGGYDDVPIETVEIKSIRLAD